MCVCACLYYLIPQWLKRELGRGRLYRNIMKLQVWIRAAASEAGRRYKQKPYFPRQAENSRTCPWPLLVTHTQSLEMAVSSDDCVGGGGGVGLESTALAAALMGGQGLGAPLVRCWRKCCNRWAGL